MSCRVDLPFDSDPLGLYSWDFGNGTVAYCPNRYSFQCSATLTTDPDIGGIGVGDSISKLCRRDSNYRIQVLVAFVITAWFTIVVAVTQSVIEISTPSETKTWLSNVCDKLLESLCDLQIITGTGIVVSGLGQISSISFYHEQLVINYWWLTLTAYWAARSVYRTREDGTATGEPSIEVNNDHSLNNATDAYPLGSRPFDRTRDVPTTISGRTAEAEQSDSQTIDGNEKEKTQVVEPLTARQKLRVSCIIISSILFVTFQIHVYFREQNQWDPFIDNHCYRCHDHSAPKSSWLWIAGQLLYPTSLLLMLKSQGRWLLNAWNRWTDIKMNNLGEWCSTTAVDVRLKFSTTFFSETRSIVKIKFVGKVLLFILGITLYSLAWCVLQFMAVWSYGIGWYPLEVIIYTAFASWDTFDIIDLKISNKPLLDGSENTWGFGQVLPMVLLAMIIFNTMDAFQEE
jgi:hypothetical protein